MVLRYYSAINSIEKIVNNSIILIILISFLFQA